MHIRQIKETCLYVADLDRTQHFYHHLLGLPLIGRVEGRHVFFRAGSSVLLCFIAAKTAVDTQLPPHGSSGPGHLAFEVEAVEYERWKAHLQETGITVEYEQEWRQGQRSCYFRDPDEHLLEMVTSGLWERESSL